MKKTPLLPHSCVCVCVCVCGGGVAHRRVRVHCERGMCACAHSFHRYTHPLSLVNSRTHTFAIGYQGNRLVALCNTTETEYLVSKHGFGTDESMGLLERPDELVEHL